MVRARICFALAVVAAALGGASWVLAAQAPTIAVPTAPRHKPAHVHKWPIAVKQQPAATPPAPIVTAPVAPEIPQWPVNEKPIEAVVTWNSQGLRIEATNSSLQQILKEVSAATGATVQGMEADQRIFGAYGPGEARDVLSQLLQGSGYNVVMIGDQGQGTPREIILSSRRSGDSIPVATAAQNQDEDVETEEQQQLPQPPIMRPGFGNGGPPRNPQQFMQQRQMQPPPIPQQPSNPPN
jgi:hypothetical protein